MGPRSHILLGLKDKCPWPISVSYPDSGISPPLLSPGPIPRGSREAGGLHRCLLWPLLAEGSSQRAVSDCAPRLCPPGGADRGPWGWGLFFGLPCLVRSEAVDSCGEKELRKSGAESLLRKESMETMQRVLSPASMRGLRLRALPEAFVRLSIDCS